jgi:erythromycin esterase-like protein
MRRLWPAALAAAAALAACTSGPAPAAPGGSNRARALLDDYARAAQRAEATKTHASGEHPRAVAAMQRAESDLAALCSTAEAKAQVSDELEGMLNQWRMEIEDLHQRRTHLQVVGRALTPEEIEWVETGAPREIEVLETRIGALQDLRGRLRLQ